MLSAKKVTNLKKLSCKYPQADIQEFISLHNKQDNALPVTNTTGTSDLALASGRVTEQEATHWCFVLSAYGNNGICLPTVCGKEYSDRLWYY